MSWANRVILVHGKKRSGKDAFAEILSESLIRVRRFAFADPLKEDLLRRFPMVMQHNLYGTNEEKEEVIPELGMSGRKLMQVYGTDMMSSLWLPVWANAALEKVKACLEQNPNHVIVVPDLRRTVELHTFQPYRPTMLKIVRPGKADDDDHSSENELNDHKFSDVIMNTGNLWEYEEKCLKWINEWAKRKG